ncbi:unnamed protein product [Prorocentrum cordatum]|uniref:Uncharacterized protein n=1 Tax=Prorocentrum cordatum TaxID=2364126 RepID=A0ABN9Q080_9DINO|nr:unnamed protein product [Polarella glacialis]
MAVSTASRTWRTPRALPGAGREGPSGLAASGQASLARPRRVAAPRALHERRPVHADERCCHARNLLGEPGERAPLLTRPRGGCCWGACGGALRVLGDCRGRHTCRTDSGSPVLLNDSMSCLQLSGAFPGCCGVGRRGLTPAALNRVLFELRTDASSPRHVAQVGLARLGEEEEVAAAGLLDEHTPLLAALLCAGSGEVQSTGGPLEVLAPGAGSPGLVQRLEDWCSGGQPWLLGDSLSATVLLEVDLRPGAGSLAISVGSGRSAAPAVVAAPMLLAEGPPWLPAVCLTAEGQDPRGPDPGLPRLRGPVAACAPAMPGAPLFFYCSPSAFHHSQLCLFCK